MYDLKIFKLNRLRFEQLWQDALSYIKKTYNDIGQQFSPASPFFQLLSVVLHMGRMIFYYIDDSITGLNIRTAYREDQIKGLATLAGHNPSRAISSRAAIRITYYDKGDNEYNGQICYIPNKIKILSKLNGLVYTVLFGADSVKFTMKQNSYIDCTIIQGTIKYQVATGTGYPLQSYNFTERNYQQIEEYFVNVKVNNESWEQVASLLDLGYNQKGVIVKTGVTGGIDIFFGNGVMGAIPPSGSRIEVEYIVSDGMISMLSKEKVNSDEYWEIQDSGYLANGTEIYLNDFFKISCLTDIIFGQEAEEVALTQMIAPHTSRAFVLANEDNYKYFFKRMNMFSIIEVMRGTSSPANQQLTQLAYEQALYNYNEIQAVYNDALSLYGSSNSTVQAYYEQLQEAKSICTLAESKILDNHYSDNTIYIFLLPDISKRIASSTDYFTCDLSVFTLSEDEQKNLLAMIDLSKQKLITVENKIVQPKIAKFAINAQVKIFETYNEEDIYASSLKKLSDFLLSFDRQDIMPISDIVALLEEVEGIDSVQVSFDADQKNQEVYGVEGFYGIDEYGDVVLQRSIVNAMGNTVKVRDILPLFRGGFTSKDGVEYSSEQSYSNTSAFNMNVVSWTSNRKINMSDYTPMT